MNAEIVCHEQTVMTRVGGNIQSSSQQNSSGHGLVLKPLNRQTSDSGYRTSVIALLQKNVDQIK